MLSEAWQAIAERDYHALRCLAGVAPVTRQTGKKTVVQMRYACNERLRDALYYWSLSSSQWDPKSKALYAAQRNKGHKLGRALRGIADRLLDVLISMLRHRTLFDPQRRVVAA